MPQPTATQIRALRTAHGLTQRKVSELLEVHRCTYEKWEYGKNPMPGGMFNLMTILLEKKL